jgi:hypothetical protein
VRRGRVESPFQDVAVDHDGAGQVTVASALLEWSDVDEDRPLGDFTGEVLDRHSGEVAPSLR